MRKHLLSCLTMLALLTGCAAPLTKTTVVERPAKAINEMAIVIEEPAFSAPGQEKDGVLKVDSTSQTALDRYRAGFYRAVRTDFARVMADNGIYSRIIYLPPVSPRNSQPLNALPLNERTRWDHVLWIRHVKGMSQCRYSYCEAFFQIEATVFDTAAGKMIWKAQEPGATYYGDKVWSDGRMYKFLLERLAADGMIALKGPSPTVNMEPVANK